MSGWLKFDYNGSDIQIIADLNVTSNRLIEALLEKMTLMMRRLQEKARGKLAGGRYATGQLADSIENPRAELEGKKIIGKLDWGKGVPYARAVEFGVPGTYVIYPLTKGGTKGAFNEKGRWRRGHLKGAIVRTGQDALYFYSERLGKSVFADYVFHPAIKAKHFMGESIIELEDTIRDEMRKTVTEVFKETKSPYAKGPKGGGRK